MDKVICNQAAMCREPQCGAEIPHEHDENECGKCPKNKEAKCIPVEVIYDRIKRFHAHLDVCSQCRNHSFDLCQTGAQLLREAATGS